MYHCIRAAAAAAAGCVSQVALSGPIAFKPQDEAWESLWLALALLVALALIAAAVVYVARRPGWRPGERTGRRLRVLERLPVSRQGTLILVECDGRTLLIGHAGTSIRLIERMEPAPRADPDAH